MNCNGYMRGFDSFRIETIYRLRHIGEERCEEKAVELDQVESTKQANSVLKAAPSDNKPQNNVRSFRPVRCNKSVSLCDTSFKLTIQRGVCLHMADSTRWQPL